MNINISATGDEIYIGSKMWTDYVLNRWYHIAIVAAKGKATLYLDGVSSNTATSSKSNTIIFGGYQNASLWFIGGAIRIIEKAYTDKHITKIYNHGIGYVIRIRSSETMIITPETFIKPFFGYRHNNDWIEENFRPVLSFPVKSHIKNACLGGVGIFQQILKKIASDDSESSQNLFHALISLQETNSTNWAPAVFGLYCSCLYHISPNLFDQETTNSILNIFVNEKEDKIDWEGLLTFTLDYGLMNDSKLRPFIISRLLGFIVRFMITDEETKPFYHLIFRFLYSVLNLLELSEDDTNIILALWSKLSCQASLICRCIVSLPDYKNKFTCPSLSYKKDFSSPLYKLMLQKLLETRKYHQFYLVHVIPTFDALKLLYPNSPLDPFFAMKFCIAHPNVSLSWSLSLTLICGQKVELDKPIVAIEKMNINFDLIPDFLIMISFLQIASTSKAGENNWAPFCNKMQQILKFMLQKLEPDHVTAKFLFALVQFLSYGLIHPASCIYPFAPDLEDADQVIGFSTKEKQPFPQGQPKPTTFAKYKYIKSSDEEVEKLYNAVQNTLPPKHFNPVPNTNPFTEAPREEFDREYCKKVLEANGKSIWDNWYDFTQKSVALLKVNKIDIDQVHSSKCFQMTIEIVVFILRKIINAPIFHDAITATTFLTTMVLPKHSLVVMRKIVFGLLNECIEKKIRSKHFLCFICDRIIEGWFSENIIELFTKMLKIDSLVNKKVHRRVVSTLIAAFDLIEPNLTHCLVELILQYESLVLAPKTLLKPNIVIPIIDKLITFRDGCPDKVDKIIKYIIKVTATEEFNQNPNFAYLNPALSEAISKGINAETLEDERQSGTAAFTVELFQLLNNSLKQTLADRVGLTTSFFEASNKYINGIVSDQMMSLCTAAIVRDYELKMLEFDINYFLRSRERIITQHMKFETVMSENKTLLLLCDPIYPTRRIEMSPMVYKVPPFPSVNVTDVSPDYPEIPNILTELPDILRDKFVTSFKLIEVLMFHTPKYHLITFSYIIPISDGLLLKLLQLFLNKGEPFLYQCPVSLLYGLDPLPGVIFKTEKNVYFVEGLVLTEKGARFSYQKMHNTLYSYYISYIIAGYFGSIMLFMSHPILTFAINEIICCLKHFWLQKPLALEVNFLNGWSYLLITQKPEDYKQIFSIFSAAADENMNCMAPQSKFLSPVNSARILRSGLKEITKQWLDGNIDNFAYLCALNRLGGRSYCDFSQYYVFPWAAKNFRTPELDGTSDETCRNLSLPMGQIGEDRKERFDITFEDSDYQYFYGTHYMHLGVVLFFMFRIEPFSKFSIYFHHGWDHPNRVFFDMEESWMSASYLSPADVKEIIPQLFCIPEIFSNVSHLPLTQTTDGRPVDRVKLADWSSDARDFTTKMRKYFENEKVSKEINNWIDLIFGIKSRGEAAAEAKNLFHKFCYIIPDEDQTDCEDPVERDAVITSIINFGQCCQQLFKNPHPARPRSSFKQHLLSEPKLIIYQRLNPAMFTFPINDLTIGKDSVSSTDGFSIIIHNQVLTYSTESFTLIRIPLSSTQTSSARALASDRQNLARLTSVNCFAASKDGVALVVGNAEGSLKTFSLRYTNKELAHPVLTGMYPTNGTVNAVAISTFHFLCLAACGKTVHRFDTGIQREVDSISLGYHVKIVDIDDRAAQIIICGEKFISIYSINTEKIMEKEVDSPVSAICVSDLEEYQPNRFIITGHDNGNVKFWTPDITHRELVLLHSTRLSEDSISAIAIDENNTTAAVATAKDVIFFDYYGSSTQGLKKTYALECSDCNTPLLPNNTKTCAYCHRFFCSKCLPQEMLLKIKLGNAPPSQKYVCSSCSEMFYSQE